MLPYGKEVLSTLKTIVNKTSLCRFYLGASKQRGFSCTVESFLCINVVDFYVFFIKAIEFLK